MKMNTITRVSHFLKRLLLGVAVMYLLVHLFIAFSRMGDRFGLGWTVGKSSHASAMALFNIVGWDWRSDVARSIADEIRPALAERRFGALILNEPQRWFVKTWFPEAETYYSEARRLFDDPTVFWPVTGMRTRPQEIFLPVER